jgi:hypothetical protein
MTNYVGQREQFVGNWGSQNETHCAKVFKMCFTDDLMELTVRETNTDVEQKNTSYMQHSISIQNTELETCH